MCLYFLSMSLDKFSNSFIMFFTSSFPWDNIPDPNSFIASWDCFFTLLATPQKLQVCVASSFFHAYIFWTCAAWIGVQRLSFASSFWPLPGFFQTSRLWGPSHFSCWPSIHSIEEWVRHPGFSCPRFPGQPCGAGLASPDKHSYSRGSPDGGRCTAALLAGSTHWNWIMVPNGCWQALRDIYVQFLILVFTVLCWCLCCIPEICLVWTWSCYMCASVYLAAPGSCGSFQS